VPRSGVDGAAAGDEGEDMLQEGGAGFVVVAEVEESEVEAEEEGKVVCHLRRGGAGEGWRKDMAEGRGGEDGVPYEEVRGVSAGGVHDFGRLRCEPGELGPHVFLPALDGFDQADESVGDELQVSTVGCFGQAEV